MIFSTAAVGTATSSPKNPPRVPPASRAIITAAGCSLTARCITIGLMTVSYTHLTLPTICSV